MTEKQSLIISLLEQNITPLKIAEMYPVTHKYVCTIRRWLASNKTQAISMADKAKAEYPPRQCRYRYCDTMFIPPKNNHKAYCCPEHQREEVKLRADDNRRAAGIVKRPPSTPTNPFENVRRDTFPGFVKYMKNNQHYFQTTFFLAHNYDNIIRVARSLGLENENSKKGKWGRENKKNHNMTALDKKGG